MESGPWKAQLRPNFPDNLLPTPGDLPGRVFQAFPSSTPPPGFQAPQGPPAHLFGKMSSSPPSLPVPF